MIINMDSAFLKQQIESLNKRMSSAKQRNDVNEYFRLGNLRALYDKQLFGFMYRGIENFTIGAGSGG